MYESYYHQGFNIIEWAEKFEWAFTPYELFMMAREGADLFRVLLEVKGVIEGKT